MFFNIKAFFLILQIYHQLFPELDIWVSPYSDIEKEFKFVLKEIEDVTTVEIEFEEGGSTFEVATYEEIEYDDKDPIVEF